MSGTTPHNVKSKRHAMLGALFCAAAERGISQEQLRDEIAPGLIGRRLSAASEKQIALVLSHIAGPMKRRDAGTGRQGDGEKRYSSSISGLRQEICDLAVARFGEGWEVPLNALCRRFGVARWQWLDVSHGREIKKRLMRWQDESATSGGDDHDGEKF